MYNLIFDTTAGSCGVCLQQDGNIIAKSYKEMDFGQAEELLVSIKDILEAQNLTMIDLDVISVCTGPGSFTGVRACIAAARIFSLALPKCKVLGVSAFESYIYDLSEEELADINAVIIETKRNDFYCQLFDRNRNKISEPLAAQYDEIIPLLKNKKVSFVGDGVERFLSISNNLSVHAIKKYRSLPVETLAFCAWKKYMDNKIDFPKPLYIKSPDLGPTTSKNVG